MSSVSRDPMGKNGIMNSVTVDLIGKHNSMSKDGVKTE